MAGFGTPVQLPSGRAKTVIVSARQAIAGVSGGASIDNVDVILVGVGSAPTNATAYTGIPLAPGETQTFSVPDASMLYFIGNVADAISYSILD